MALASAAARCVLPRERIGGQSARARRWKLAAARKECEEGEYTIVQREGRPIVYEALLTQSASLSQLQVMRRQIEQVGGALRIEQAGAAILVTLTLPEPYAPEQFFPGIPFFPV